jgi:acetylornithine deacetylase/succinyl-diaminopimelate desuccinylase-like protein
MGVENAPDATHCLALKHACELEGIQPELQTAHYATDAAIYQEAGIPCVVFGPGSIQQAHTADEHIEISQISRAADIILRLLTEEN